MNDFLNEASTLHWWLGVVLVGIAIHLVAKGVEHFGGRMSRYLGATFRGRFEVLRERRRQLIEALRADPRSRDDLLADEIRARLRSLSGLGLSIMCLVLFGFVNEIVGPDVTPSLAKAFRLAILVVAALSLLLTMFEHGNAMRAMTLRAELDEPAITP